MRARPTLSGALGTIGGILTLAASLQLFMTPAEWLEAIITGWVAALTYVWRQVFFFLDAIAPHDAKILSLTFFYALHAAAAAKSPRPAWNGLWFAPAMLLVLLTFAGMVDQIEGAVRDPGANEALLFQTLGAAAAEQLGHLSEWLDANLRSLPASLVHFLGFFVLYGGLIAPMLIPPVMLLVFIVALRILYDRWINWREFSWRLLRMAVGVIVLALASILTTYVWPVASRLLGFASG